MTVKQFGYVAVGVIGAVIIYYLPLKGALAILLKILLIPLFGASGFAAAFLPIDGRPIDVMAGNFLKALFAPNQYVYRKESKKFSFSNIPSAKAAPTVKPHAAQPTPTQKMAIGRSQELRRLLNKSSEGKIKNDLDAREAVFLKSFSAIPSTPGTPTAAQSVRSAPANPFSFSKAPTLPLTTAPSVNPQPPRPPASIPTPAPQAAPKQSPTPEALSEKEDSLKKQLEQAKHDEATQHDAKELALSHQKAIDLAKQVEEIHSQKQKLEEEIANLKQQLATQSMAVAPVIQSERKETPNIGKVASHVRSVPKELNKKLGLLTSDTPNVVTGMVKDSRGNVLPNILVEIKDKNDNPVRAFKTNALGNFASATPLAPGTYTITLEDLKKQHTFDSIQITLSNQIMLPIEITSYDKREELRKDLFS